MTRPYPYRLRRIWQMVEEIQAHPGFMRAQLAMRAGLSERALQDDLDHVRGQMRLPLVRKGGYRLWESGDCPSGDFIVFAMIVHLVNEAAVHRWYPDAPMHHLLGSIRGILPLHVRWLCDALAQHAYTVQLLEAIIRQQAVRLLDTRGIGDSVVAVMVPEVILPENDSWVVVDAGLAVSFKEFDAVELA